MPCDSITTVTVDVAKMQPDLVVKALADMGLSPQTREARPGFVWHTSGTIDTKAGKALWYGDDRTTELKRSYSAQVIKTQAQKFGWTLKQDKNDRYAFSVGKR